MKGNSIGDFWFATKLDAIKENADGLKQSVVHQYFDEAKGELVECLKIRYYRKENPEYWEPAKHLKSYGFTKTAGLRVSPIELKVKHLDFRGELPAFDKYFYFPDPKHLQERHYAQVQKGTKSKRHKYSKQDYLRNLAPRIRNDIKKRGIPLGEEALKAIRYILERDYSRGILLKHSHLHGHEGWTIVFESNSSDSYSDAFAGSGESAATLLVHNILEAPEKSLILLDEPETSLHPRAQQRMMEFLAHQAVRKSLQIVISTHSIHLTEKLPAEAIKLLQLGTSGHVSAQTDITAREALHEIGSFPSGKTILVEDERARSIAIAALKFESEQSLKEFKVVVQKGGTAKIFRDIRAFCLSERRNVVVLLDGDHRFQQDIPKDKDLPQGKENLEKLIQQLTKGNNSKGPEVKEKLGLENTDEMMNYISFLRNYVHFLPAHTPEHLVWDDMEAKQLLGQDLPEVIVKEKDYKKKIKLLTDQLSIPEPDAVFQILLAKLLQSSDQRKELLLECFKKIRTLTHS